MSQGAPFAPRGHGQPVTGLPPGSHLHPHQRDRLDLMACVLSPSLRTTGLLPRAAKEPLSSSRRRRVLGTRCFSPWTRASRTSRTSFSERFRSSSSAPNRSNGRPSSGGWSDSDGSRRDSTRAGRIRTLTLGQTPHCAVTRELSFKLGTSSMQETTAAHSSRHPAASDQTS